MLFKKLTRDLCATLRRSLECHNPFMVFPPSQRVHFLADETKLVKSVNPLRGVHFYLLRTCITFSLLFINCKFLFIRRRNIFIPRASTLVLFAHFSVRDYVSYAGRFSEHNFLDDATGCN